MASSLYDATWGRAVAWGYDRFQTAAEQAGMRERRRELVGQARGRVIEIGAGTGLNLDHYTGEVDELVLTEPDPYMAAQLRRRVETSGRAARVVEAPAEELPFEDSSFDTAVVTLVLCTVPDQAAALREIERVLVPGGTLLFLEHVRSTDPRTARWQDRLEAPWRWFGRGCRCNRETLEAIRSSPLEVERVERGEQPKAPPIVRPMVLGAARAPARS